jgi:hypothetical protein
MQYPSVKANGFCMMTLAALLRALARNLLSKSMEETIRRVRGKTVLRTKRHNVPVIAAESGLPVSLAPSPEMHTAQFHELHRHSPPDISGDLLPIAIVSSFLDAREAEKIT